MLHRLSPFWRVDFHKKYLLVPVLGALVGGAAARPPAPTRAEPLRHLFPRRLADGSVAGRVVDGHGEGIPGVTVIVEGTSLRASTNADGFFVIVGVPAGPHTLVYSSVGLSSTRVAGAVQDGRATQVAVTTLGENITARSEAVVVGYGTVRRQDLTGAVATVTARDFGKGQVTSPEQLMQGQLAGGQITTGSTGLDYGFFDNRLTGSVDVYLRQTTDLLAVTPIPIGRGFTPNLLTNIGSLENRGIELGVRFSVPRPRPCAVSSRFNLLIT